MHSRDPVIAPLRCLQEFAQAVHVKRLLETTAVEPKQTFWLYMINVLFDRAAIEWAKVFGSNQDDTHWTNAIPEADRDAVRSAMLTALKMNKDEWEAYRELLISYRDQLAAHHDLAADVKTYPKYDAALVAADFMYAELFSRLPDEKAGGLHLELERWSATVAKNMRPIVQTAFGSSARLGSNVK